MRIFIAAPIPRQVLQDVDDWLSPIRSRHRNLRWVSPDRMHITLRFLGDVDLSVISRIDEIMEQYSKGPIDFSFDRLGSFSRGRSKVPSVLWLGGSFDEGIFTLARNLARIEDQKGRSGPGRGFIPHLTLARLRKRAGRAPRLPDPGPWPGTIDRIVVFNSTLTPEGPEYESLKEYDLH